MDKHGPPFVFMKFYRYTITFTWSSHCFHSTIAKLSMSKTKLYFNYEIIFSAYIAIMNSNSRGYGEKNTTRQKKATYEYRVNIYAKHM